MNLAGMIKNATDPAAALKALLDGQEGETLKKSVRSLREGGVDDALLVPYDEDAIEVLLAGAERTAAEVAATGDVIAQLDAALEKSRRLDEPTPSPALPAEMVDAIADRVVERLGAARLMKSVKAIEARLAPMESVLKKSGQVIALTLGESLSKSGRAAGVAPAERKTQVAGSPGAKKLSKSQAKSAFKRGLRLAQAANDAPAIEKLSQGAILLDALDPADRAAVQRVDEALRFAVGYKG